MKNIQLLQIDIFQWLSLIFNGFSRQNVIFSGQHEIPWLLKARLKLHDFSRLVCVYEWLGTFYGFCLSVNHCVLIVSWPNSQFQEWICSISHNAPLRTEMCTLLFWMEHRGIWNRCIMEFVKLVYWTAVNKHWRNLKWNYEYLLVLWAEWR